MPALQFQPPVSPLFVSFLKFIALFFLKKLLIRNVALFLRFKDERRSSGPVRLSCGSSTFIIVMRTA